MKKTIYTLLITTVLVSVSCDKEYLNPSSASAQQVLTDVNGLFTVANGLQYKYSITRLSPNYTVPTAGGLVTREMIVLNAGNTDEQLLMQGGAGVVGSNSVVRGLWEQSNLVKSNADNILNSLGIVTDQGIKGGLMAHASIFKAMALGNLAMFWESAPITVGKNAPFVDRLAVLAEAIAVLDAAAAELAKAPLPANFTTRIVPNIDYANTINALTARYALMAGNYDKALTAANAVNLAVTVKSSFTHDDLTRNALFEISFSNRNVCEPLDDKFSLPVGMQTPASDKRIAFFINPAASATVNKGRASFFQANTTSLPIYRGGEVTLIKAEAYARKGSPADLTNAVTELNKVLTKTPAQDAWGIGADQPVYSGLVAQADILTEIYRQRCIELYLTGMRLEDSRRFARPASERTRTFLPYPFTERDNNTSTPADPAG